MEHTQFRRFSRSQRIQHLVAFTSFTVLALTGLPQRWAHSGWAQALIAALGGIHAVRLVHRWAAVVLIAAFAYHLAWGVWALLVRRRPFAILPRRKDAEDAWGNLLYFLSLRPRPPLFDKFTYKEKFEYWALFWGTAIMAASGLVLWFPALATRWLPGVAVPISKAAHSGEALLAVLAVVLWHLYNAHFTPEIFPFNRTIFSGRISAERQLREHPLEYARLTGTPVEALPRTDHRLAGKTLLLSGLVSALAVGLMVAMVATGFGAEAPEIEVRPTRVPVVYVEPTPLPPTATPTPTQTPAPTSTPTLTPSPTPTNTLASEEPTPTSAPPTATPAPTATPQPVRLGKPVPHAVAGQENCSLCHVPGGAPPLGSPADHAGRSASSCLTCHRAP